MDGLWGGLLLAGWAVACVALALLKTAGAAQPWRMGTNDVPQEDDTPSTCRREGIDADRQRTGDLRALRREIEARRDAHTESRTRLGEILEESTLFHHDDRAETDSAEILDD